MVIGHAAHAGLPLECRKDVEPFIEWVTPYRNGVEAEVVSVAKDPGGGAVGRVRLPGGSVVSVSFSRHGGEWKLDGLYDSGLSRIQVRSTPREDRYLLEAGDVPVIDGDTGVAVRPVSGRSAGARGCPRFDMSEFPAVDGGCRIDVEGEAMALSVGTPFGVLRFGDCALSYTAHVDGSGRAWLMEVAFVGPSPCLDVMACWDTDGERVPWAGRIVRTGGDSLRMEIEDACLDTCIGRFVGDWGVAMVERRDGWRLHARDEMVGTSGWRFDGVLRSHGRRIAVDRRSGR